MYSKDELIYLYSRVENEMTILSFLGGVIPLVAELLKAVM